MLEASDEGRDLSDWYCDEILSGQRPIDLVAETAAVLAFHHTRPSYDAAHVVVIPKLHIGSILSDHLTDMLLLEILNVVRAVAANVLRETRACRIVTNLGEYQESKHLHWHVVSGALIARPVELAPSPSAQPYTHFANPS